MTGSETESGAGIDPRRFRNVLGQFCTGVTIITTVDDGAPVGFACQSFAALSLEPPLVLFCPTKASRSWAAIERSGRFCVNVLAECTSVYRWQGAIENAAEVPLLIKTAAARYEALEQAIRELHPYELPEIVAVPIQGGLPGYLQWVAAETRSDNEA